MFTGIIEATGTVEKIIKNESNIDFVLSCGFTHELKIDQSLAHNGCCLTVVETYDDKYKAVSYTHLDVYKRQDLFFRNIFRNLRNRNVMGRNSHL